MSRPRTQASTLGARLFLSIRWWAPGYFRAAFPASLSGRFCSSQRKHSRNSSSGCNPRTTPVPAPALNWDQNHLQNGTFGVCCSIVGDRDLTANGVFAGYRNLQASHPPISNRRPSPKLTLITSTLFRRNWTMLGVVFAGAFAFELYVAA